MKKPSKDILFIAYFFTVTLLSFLYFSVPERALFMENQITWWKEFVLFVVSYFQQ
ncbi:MAG: hypothetical protein JSV71_06460 [Nitrospiraceae bacterium]|nr:MAG: hypothetical protein JSV71_06460 [Nitrospiraceae bacterium]